MTNDNKVKLADEIEALTNYDTVRIAKYVGDDVEVDVDILKTIVREWREFTQFSCVHDWETSRVLPDGEFTTVCSKCGKK